MILIESVDKTGHPIDPENIQSTRPDPNYLFEFKGVPIMSLGSVSATNLRHLQHAINNKEADVIWRV